MCGYFYPEGDYLEFHMAVCQGVTNSTHAENVPVPPQTQKTPQNTIDYLVLGSVEVNGVQTSYDLLKKVITETIRSDPPATKNSRNDHDYWENQEREVRLNEGRTPSRTWETDQNPQVMSNQSRHTEIGQCHRDDPRTTSHQEGHPGEVQCPVIEGSDLTDSYEEQPIVIDLEDDTNLPKDDGVTQ